MLQGVEMFLAGEEQRTIKTADFEGKLSTEMRYEIIGELGGQRFDAELETPYGRDSSAFLVSEQTRGLGSVISVWVWVRCIQPAIEPCDSGS